MAVATTKKQLREGAAAALGLYAEVTCNANATDSNKVITCPNLLDKAVDNERFKSSFIWRAEDKWRLVSAVDVDNATITVKRAWADNNTTNVVFSLYGVLNPDEWGDAINAAVGDKFYKDRITIPLVAGQKEYNLGMAKVGLEFDSALLQPILANHKYVGGPYTVTTPLYLTSVAALVSSDSPPQVAKAVIYLDDGNGLPGVLLATSDEVSVTQSAPPLVWTTFPLSQPPLVSYGTLIHIGIHWSAASAGDLVCRTPLAGKDDAYNADTYADGPADPFGTPTALSVEIACYANGERALWLQTKGQIIRMRWRDEQSGATKPVEDEVAVAYPTEANHTVKIIVPSQPYGANTSLIIEARHYYDAGLNADNASVTLPVRLAEVAVKHEALKLIFQKMGKGAKAIFGQQMVLTERELAEQEARWLDTGAKRDWTAEGEPYAGDCEQGGPVWGW